MDRGARLWLARAVRAGGSPVLAVVGADDAAIEFELILQWAVATQLAELGADLRDRGASLYLDLPIGTSAGGYDVWESPDDFAVGTIDIEVWARLEIAAALVTPKIVLSLEPNAGASFGASQYSAEYGATGKLLALANQARADAEIKAEFAFADGSNLTANPAVIATLSINGGDAEDRITVNLSIMPTDESDWTWAAS